MTATTKISVALCAHNGADFIEEQLLSILRQSLPAQEIVLSDDASSDDTLARARSVVGAYVGGDPEHPVELRIIENPEALGVTANFEQAVRACAGELIVLCDQDDRWSPDRLAVAAAAFAERPELLLLHGDARLIDEQGKALPFTLFESLEVSNGTISAIHAGSAFDELMRRNVVTGATTMLRRRLVEESIPFPDGWVHDEWLAIMASALGEVDVTDELLIDYRQHGTNQIGVRKLSVLGKFPRLVEPGTQRNRRLLARSGALVDRFDSLRGVVPESRLDAAREKLRHEEMRSALSPHRLLRLVPIARELKTGRYSRFGRGVADAVRDLIQPL